MAAAGAPMYRSLLNNPKVAWIGMSTIWLAATTLSSWRQAVNASEVASAAPSAAVPPSASASFMLLLLEAVLQDPWHQMSVANGIAALISVIFEGFSLLLGGVDDEDRRSIHSFAVRFIFMKLLLVASIVDALFELPWLLWFAWFAGMGALQVVASLAKRKLAGAGRPDGPPLHKVLSALLIVLSLNVLLAVAMTTALIRVDVHLLFLLLVDNITVGMSCGHCGGRALIAQLESGSPGGWEPRATATAWIDLLLEGGQLVVLLLHTVHCFYVLGGFHLSVLDFALLNNANSAYQSLKTSIAAFAAHVKLQQALSSQFPDATEEQLLADEDEDSAACLHGNESGSSGDAGGVGGTTSTDGLRYRGGSSGSGAGAGVGVAQGTSSADPVKPGKRYKDCVICLEPMTAGKRLPVCGHLFHRACLKRYLMGGQTTCPVCRQGLTQELAAAKAAREQMEREREEQARRMRNLQQQQQQQHQAPAAPQAAGGAGGALVRLGGALGGLLPGIEFEFARNMVPPTVRVDDAVAQLADAFPHIGSDALRYHLLHVARGDVSATAEAALAGQIQAPPTVAAAAAAAAAAPAAPAPARAMASAAAAAAPAPAPAPVPAAPAPAPASAPAPVPAEEDRTPMVPVQLPPSPLPATSPLLRRATSSASSGGAPPPLSLPLQLSSSASSASSAASAAPPPSGSGAGAATPVLTAEELRQRRLEAISRRLGAASPQ